MRISHYRQLTYDTPVRYLGEVWYVRTVYESGDVTLVTDNTGGGQEYTTVHCTELDEWIEYPFD